MQVALAINGRKSGLIGVNVGADPNMKVNYYNRNTSAKNWPKIMEVIT